MQNQFNGGKVVFSTNGTGVIDHPQAQKEREDFDLYLYKIYTTYTKINSEWIMD